MRLKAFVVVFLLAFSVLSLAQEKAKNDILATTEDGKRVLLRANGTWEFVKEEVAKEWRQVVVWKGSGTKKTEPFSIASKEWRICWTTKAGEFGGIFQIMVYKGESELPEIAANVMETSTDCSYMKGPGEHRLTINASQAWTVVVEEKTKND